MNPISLVMVCFALLGAADLMIGNKFGLGNQFKRGIMLLGSMVMSMVGMLVLAPLIAHFLNPIVGPMASALHFEPSVIPAMLLANDMGGYTLAMEFATNPQVGYYNGLIVSAMMGVTISFNIPFSMGVVPKEKHEPLLLGLLCGIITTPVGCLISAFIVKLPIIDLLASLIPLLLCAIILAVALFLWPRACVKVFKVFGVFINTIIIFGLAVGIFEGVTGIELIPYTAPIGDAFDVCTNAAMVMSGAFTLIYIISKILDKPMKKVGKLMGINTASALGFLSTLATNMTTYGNMQDMDDKGLLLNSAFSVSAGFVFAGHLAFTLVNNPADQDYSVSMMVGKVVSGICAVIVAILLHKIMGKRNAKPTPDLPSTEENLSSVEDGLPTPKEV